MQNRLKKIRADFKLTQGKFAESLGLSQNYIAQVEIGKKDLGDRAVRDICRIYGINELWLRTGIEPMYVAQDREAEMTGLIKRLMSDSPESFRSALVTTLLRFDPNGPEWEILERIYHNIAAEMEKTPEP